MILQAVKLYPAISIADTMIEYVRKTVLGCAQLGRPYGIANTTGVPSRDESYRILQTAWESGIRHFDTAPSYNSEAVLGEFVRAEGLQDEIQILTKISKLGSEPNWKDAIDKSVATSLGNLHCGRIKVLLLHDPNDVHFLLTEPEYFWGLLSKFPIKTLGVSAYEPEDVDRVKDCGIALAFQFPFSLLDRRFETNAIATGKRYARSIFLQGLLASSKLIESAPRELKQLHKIIGDDCQKHNISSRQQALKFAADSKSLDFFLMGVESVAQLRQLLKTDLTPEIDLPLVQKWRSLVNPNWLDPRTWNSQKN